MAINVAVEKRMCIYCAKWFPESEMQQLPKKEYDNWYCTKCFPEVMAAYWKLPWNRK
ncbi:hypothetical protein QFZ28_005930 [Neobacillus niacini]|uniref:hypothetical protein n=1 Tax=Neobacillus niacini TaxID=86668 RepID=UPI002789896B|nr:hypothetical protein [Neobacillus niacini]MDQ1005352.1 hypothetical protein [Neobacillus niacini]